MTAPSHSGLYKCFSHVAIPCLRVDAPLVVGISLQHGKGTCGPPLHLSSSLCLLLSTHHSGVSLVTGLDYWTGLLDWTTGLDYWTQKFTHKISFPVQLQPPKAIHLNQCPSLGHQDIYLVQCFQHWKKSRISLRQIAIQYRAKFPVHFPAPVLEKLRTGIGQVQKSVQEITPYTFEGNVVSFRKCSGF